MDEPLFAVDQPVWVHGRAAKVLEVHTEQYFTWGSTAFYEYTITYLDEPGSKHKMSEKILDCMPKKALLCECGAWAVHWASEQHARYCPAYKWEF
jgi:hypothetical protein